MTVHDMHRLRRGEVPVMASPNGRCCLERPCPRCRRRWPSLHQWKPHPLSWSCCHWPSPSNTHKSARATECPEHGVPTTLSLRCLTATPLQNVACPLHSQPIHSAAARRGTVARRRTHSARQQPEERARSPTRVAADSVCKPVKVAREQGFAISCGKIRTHGLVCARARRKAGWRSVGTYTPQPESRPRRKCCKAQRTSTRHPK